MRVQHYNVTCLNFLKLYVNKNYCSINILNICLQGGMILLASALKEPTIFDGIVLMAPLIFIDPALATPVKLWAARLFSRITPQLTVYILIKSLLY